MVLCGLVCLFFFSGLGYGLYIDRKRKLLGATLGGTGLLLAGLGLWQWLFGWGM